MPFYSFISAINLFGEAENIEILQELEFFVSSLLWASGFEPQDKHDSPAANRRRAIWRFRKQRTDHLSKIDIRRRFHAQYPEFAHFTYSQSWHMPASPADICQKS